MTGTNARIDGTGAAAAAVGYFRTLSPTGPIGFAIESTDELGTGSGNWKVVCSMWDFIGATVRSKYEVLVGSNGRVNRVARIYP
jgi:hypothetical protein